MSLRECFEKRLLRETKKDLKKAHRSLEIAYQKLQRAKLAFNQELFDSAIILGYTAMFHAARCLLYKDGIQEKSHFCVVLYLRGKYGAKIPVYLINSMDNFRVERHEILYGLEFVPTREDAETLLRDARQFIEITEKLL